MRVCAINRVFQQQQQQQPRRWRRSIQWMAAVAR
jgi:hypothetical protein